jgi:4-hydroxy-L-threonine phosphate dehydrogenase PdxA
MTHPGPPRIAITTGDPAGVGPGIITKALLDAEILPIGAGWLLETPLSSET